MVGTIRTLVLVVAGGIAMSSVAVRGGEPVGPAKPAAKKLIEWGWDEPDTAFMRRHIASMEEMPFDGLVFHVTSPRGGNFTWEMWGPRRFQRNEFDHAVEDLRATPFRRLTERFLRVNVTPGRVDWFDDAAWAVVLNNMQVAAQVARDGGCKGFMFDVEQYEGQLFDYAQQAHRASKPFAQYQAKVRQRGAEWMKVVAGEYPQITILLTFGYSIAQPRGGAKDRSQVSYGLLADFLDGVLEACPAGVRLVDAWESSYPYREASQFRQAYQTIKERSAGWSAVFEKYRQHVSAGFGLWMDCNWRSRGWNTTDFAKNHFTPEQFAEALRQALATSDQYVWIYTEQPRWWTRERLPKEYIEAVRAARQAAGLPNP